MLFCRPRKSEEVFNEVARRTMDGRTDGRGRYADAGGRADARPESLNGEVGAVIAAQSRASLNSIYAGLGSMQGRCSTRWNFATAF